MVPDPATVTDQIAALSPDFAGELQKLMIYVPALAAIMKIVAEAFRFEF